MEKKFRKFYEHFSFIRAKKEKKFKIATIQCFPCGCSAKCHHLFDI